jgi:hypothetical protein
MNRPAVRPMLRLGHLPYVVGLLPDAPPFWIPASSICSGNYSFPNSCSRLRANSI